MSERTKKTFLNIGSNFIITIATTILSFLTRTIFIYCLGKEALGLNGLFTNILSMLSLAELGVGTAINFSLYKLLVKDDKKQISALMNFYKKTYRIIGFSIAVLGIFLIPFLKYFVKGIESVDNVYLIYLIYLLNTVSTYFISYKETLINADQKKYKLSIIELVYVIILNVFQIIFLLITKNFVAYLFIQFLIGLVKRIFVNIYVTKNYPDIDFNSKEEIEKEDFELIKKNVKAMFFHKFGEYCLNGTDNIIISSFINIETVGLYSNYLTIIGLLKTFVSMIYNNMIASLGNFIVTESTEKQYNIFKKMDFIGFVLFGFCSVVLINVFNDFINIWIGNEYCLEFGIVIIIVINFYLTGMRVPVGTLKMAAGLYDADKYTPLVQSLINLFFSIILARKIGLLGVLLGTAISSIAVPSWQKPYLVYKQILQKPVSNYFFRYFKYIFILIFTSLLSLLINSLLVIKNGIILFLTKVFITTLIFFVIVFTIFRKSDEMIYIIDTIKKIFMKRSQYEKRFN